MWAAMMRRSFISLAIFVTALLVTATAYPAAYSLADTPVNDEDYRLGLDWLLPVHYDIFLKPDFASTDRPTDIEYFEGNVIITVNITEDIPEIKLHVAKNILTKSITIKKVNGDGEEDINFVTDDTINATLEFLKVNLNLTTEYIIGTYKIYIEYRGRFPGENDKDPMYGFYKSTYTAVDSESGSESSRLLLATQFQPTHARKAFPCFDEPGYKATYNVTIEVPSDYGVLGNTEVRKVEKDSDAGEFNSLGDGPKETTKESIQYQFSVPVKMSTYLLAFLIYEKASYNGTGESESTIPFRTFARSVEIQGGQDGNAELSQKDSPRILHELEEYTGISYALGKVDQAAIPDFAAGAMENWGLVTYREQYLLFNPLENTEGAKRRVVEIIAHELAHQWFGNLVTTEWWSATWLNEGFATYFEYYITDVLYSEWRMMERLVVDEQQNAFAVDALASAKPLTDESVNTPEQVILHFSTISYSKGGSILRMIINAMEEENFRTAIKEYLENNVYSSVKPDELFSALESQWPEVPNNFFKSWTTQPGYPLINVERIEGTKIIISQKRFMLDASTREEVYIVPLIITVEGEEESERFWLTNKSTEWKETAETNSWILVNNTGYFRVNYTEQNWDQLTKNIKLFPEVQKASLIDDALNLARGNQLNYNVTFKLVGTLKEEIDFIPWSAAFSGLAYLYRLLVQVDEENIFDKFVLDIVKPVYDELGFEADENNNDTNVRAAHRTNVLTWACRSGHKECVEAAVAMLSAYVDNATKVDPDLRSVVYCYGVKHGDWRLWLYLWDKLKTIQDAAERALLLPALGCVDSPTTLHMYLEHSITGQYIRSQDASSVFSAVYSNPVGVDVALDFLVKETDAVFRSYGSMNALPNIIRGIAQHLHSDEQIEKLKKLKNFNSTDDDIDRTVHDAVDAAVASVVANREWVQENKENVLDAMKRELDNGGNGDDGGNNGGGGNNDGGAFATQPTMAVLAVALVAASLARY